MRNMSTILAAILCSIAPLASEESINPKKEFYTSSFRGGREIISSIRSQYEKGQYRPFLEEMDGAYKKADLTSFMELRKKEIPLEFQEKWEDRFSELRLQKNEELLNALSDHDNTLFAQKVRSLASNLTQTQEKALSKLNALVTMAPGSGANKDENTLISLDLEYEYKMYEADLAPSLSDQEKQERQIALRMEKMEKMVQASHSFQDLSLKQAVEICKDTQDLRLARNLDGADLNTWSKSSISAANSAEKKIFSILSSYQEKFADLMKELDQANR